MAVSIATVLQAASEEASALGAPVVGTEHLLLGALRQQNSDAVRLLAQHAVDYQQVIIACKNLRTHGGDTEARHGGAFSNRAHDVLQFARDMAAPNEATDTHLLIALLLNQQTFSSAVLQSAAQYQTTRVFDPFQAARDLLTLVDGPKPVTRHVQVEGGLRITPRTRFTEGHTGP